MTSAASPADALDGTPALDDTLRQWIDVQLTSAAGPRLGVLGRVLVVVGPEI